MLNHRFPSPVEDYKDSRLSLDERLIYHPTATFFCIAKGHSMSELGIGDGAILVVDRSLKVQGGDIVVVIIDGEHLVRCVRFNQVDSLSDSECAYYASYGWTGARF